MSAEGQPFKHTNMLGKLISRVHNARRQVKAQAEHELWNRNQLGNPMRRNGYKMAETARIQRDGTEVVEYRLYKLIDVARVTIRSEVQTTTEFGLEQAGNEEENAG